MYRTANARLWPPIRPLEGAGDIVELFLRSIPKRILAAKDRQPAGIVVLGPESHDIGDCDVEDVGGDGSDSDEDEHN